MAATKNSVQFTVDRTYTVSHPKFTMFRNVEYLDAAKLSKGTHTIELGKFGGASCDCAVMGKVKNGKLVAIEHPKCDNAVQIPPALNKKLQAARKQLARGSDVRWEDIPIGELTTSQAARNRVIIVITTIDDCVEICTVMANGMKICMICCPTLGWCIGPSDPQVAMF
ncbi:MAG: hypothetical protein ABIW03_06925 [Sphingomicrobium sp.]